MSHGISPVLFQLTAAKGSDMGGHQIVGM